MPPLSQYNKDLRTIAAIVVVLLFLGLCYGIIMVLQTTDSITARIIASSVIVVLLFVMILVVTCIQEPDAYQKAFKKKSKFQERLNRAYKEHHKIKDERHYHSRLN